MHDNVTQIEQENSMRITRKLVMILFVALLITGATTVASVEHAAAQSNPIVLENQNPGTSSWRINFNIGTLANDVNNQIKG